MENITGSNGNDTITGDNDKNTLTGLNGDDVLSGQGGNDYINGGLGSDTASYSEKTVSVTVDFKTGLATTTIESDTLVSIENIIGGTVADLFKMNEDNIDNAINGGNGSDTVSYEYYVSNGVKVNLSTSLAQIVVAGTDNDVDTLTNIEIFQVQLKMIHL